MNVASFAIRNRVVTLVLTVVMLGGGLSAYQGMSRLEDPEFTIKDALVITPYPGASAEEVEQEVTDELELAVQQMKQLDEIESRSERGLSTLTITMKDRYDKDSLPQVWDELRRKIGDAQRALPPGAGPSLVVDDYGDVFGVFVAVYGPEYTYAELKRFVDFLRRELVLVQDVARVETYGERVEAVYIELRRDRMAELGIAPAVIVDELREKNLVADAGRVRLGPEYVALEPTGQIDSVEEFESLRIAGGNGRQILLRDVAEVRRGYVEPQDHLIRYDGNPAIGLGISTVSGGNVVRMGEAIRDRVAELEGQFPLGIEAGVVSLQSEAVVKAIRGFTSSLVQAVAIVIVVLLFFMGLRSGLLIGFILVLTIAGSFIFLAPMGVALERISLGALIIALGMLVDNAIVVVDGVLTRLQRGDAVEAAAAEVVDQSALPLLGATVIAILAFAAIGTSQDSTGEFCRSLFQVVSVSLLLSWVTAVTVTPLLCVLFLRAPGGAGSSDDDAGKTSGGFYGAYTGFLRACIRGRLVTVAVVIALFAVSVWGFGFVGKSFFPPSTRPQLMVDLWLPQGTHIEETTRQAAALERDLLQREGVEHVTSLVGKGALRFLLTYTPEKVNSAYAQLLVDVSDTARMDTLIPEIEAHIATAIPDALGYASRFQLGPGSTGKIQARFSGPDAAVLRELAEKARAILLADPDAKAVRTDWRQKVKVLRPTLAEQEANRAGIRRPDVATVLRQAFEGAPIGVYREQDLRLPIVMRAAERERTDVASFAHLQIWSPAAKRMIPMAQVVEGVETGFEDEIIVRRDRKRTLTVFGDPIHGAASTLLARVRPAIEALPLPPDYALEWGGEYEDSSKAQGALAASLPAFVLVMLLVTVALFNSLRQPLLIWANVPLAVIGVTAGLLVTSQPFGFMALLGFLSLSGMLIKNAIVLIDEINLQSASGKPPLAAVVDSSASRLRPVAMAASTTALGMIPLLTDAFFRAMAVTIIAGLVFATVLTMVVLPVAYTLAYGIPKRDGPDA